MLEKTKAPRGRGFKLRTGRFAHRNNTALEAARFIGKSIPGFVIANGWINLPKTNDSV